MLGRNYVATRTHGVSAYGVIGVNTPASWAVDLNSQAHAVMAEMDQTIFEYTQKFVIPRAVGPAKYDFSPLPGQRLPSDKEAPARATGGHLQQWAARRGYRYPAVATALPLVVQILRDRGPALPQTPPPNTSGQTDRRRWWV